MFHSTMFLKFSTILISVQSILGKYLTFSNAEKDAANKVLK
uniref:Uncharacterized protein n=1 Tax=Arundo donax TaxID=35708 RepID=A0A0A8YIN8_ARUDO